MIEYLPLTFPILMAANSITLFLLLESSRKVHLSTIELGLTGFATVFTVLYLRLLRKASISKYSRKIVITALISSFCLTTTHISAHIISANEGLLLERCTYDGHANLSLQSKILRVFCYLMVFFLGLTEYSLGEGEVLENLRPYQIKEFLAARRIPVICETIRNSPTFIRIVAVMPFVCLILGIQIQTTPMKKEGASLIRLAYNANIKQQDKVVQDVQQWFAFFSGGPEHVFHPA